MLRVGAPWALRGAAGRAARTVRPTGGYVRARHAMPFALDDLPERAADRNGASSSAVPAPAPTTRARRGGGVAAAAAAAPEWPPLAQCVLENMRKFPSCMLLTRVGGFYEAYFEQAPQLASDIGIKLASRKWAGQTIAMAGFPIFQLDKYLKVLVQEKRRLVAICDEFKEEDHYRATAPFQRRVTRVVSPGTLIDERFLDPFANNFILSVAPCRDTYGLAWLDVSTSDFQTAMCHDTKAVRDTIVRIQPREVVLMPDQPLDGATCDALDMVRTAVAYAAPADAAPADAPTLVDAGRSHSDAERDAVAMLTAYLTTRLMEHMPGLSMDAASGSHAPRDAMHLDAHTLSALEIREAAYDGGVRGSLLSTVRRTTTQGGARLLTQWLTQPSTSVPLIRARHALVELLLRRAFLRKDVRMLLRTGIGDILRTLQRISLRRNDEQDLLEVRDFVRTTDAVVRRCFEELPLDGHAGAAELTELLARFQSLHALGEQLGNAIDERVIAQRMQRQEALLQDAATPHAPAPTDEPVRRVRRKDSAPLLLEAPLWGDAFEHLVRPDASPVLRAYTDEYDALRRRARELENALRVQFQEPLTLRFLLGQGHVVHVPSARGIAHDSLALAYKTKTTRTYYHGEWTKIGTKLQRLAAKLAEREAHTLEALRQAVLAETPAVRRNARLVDQLDVLLSFAQAAEELSLTRPTVDASQTLVIRGGRHLGVEMGLLERQRLFTRNDLVLGEHACMHLVTGPNMGGKSTFLRQNALIVVLAQAGSFVPADAAHVGVVDRIFSRVGAKDDLFHSRSTFMVEMSETAEILRRATPRSFVIADEIGRGTNTSVGLALAFATLHTLAVRIGCRSLFATHYYELADMLEGAHGALAERVAFYCTTLEQGPWGIRYVHRVRPGVNRASHGLDVARLADMPPDTLDLAVRTHAWLERQGTTRIATEGLLPAVLPLSEASSRT